MPIPGWRLGVFAAIAIAIFFAGDKSGSNRVQAKWDKAELRALAQQAALNKQAEDERDLANDLLLEGQIALEDAERKSERLNDALQIAINTEPVVTTVSIPAPAGCPVVLCPIPNASAYFRLFNSGISNTPPKAISAPDQTVVNPLPETSPFALMDGIYESKQRRSDI